MQKHEIGLFFGAFCGGAFRGHFSLQKHAGEPGHAEAHGAPEVDVPEVDWADPAQDAVVNSLPAGLQPIDGLLQPHRVPADHDVRQERM